MKKHPILLVLLTALLLACQNVDEVPITDWLQLEDFQGEARASAACFVYGDKAYICCGRLFGNSRYLKEFWQYDAQMDTWSRLTDFPGDARVKPVGVVIGDTAYIGMGAYGWGTSIHILKDFWAYDLRTNTWIQKASFPGASSNDLAYGVVNGCLYTAMGYDGTSRSDECWKYDPSTDVWAKLSNSPHAYSVPAFFAIGDDFYVGTGFQGRNIRSFFRYDTSGDSWVDIASAPDARILSNGLAIGDKGYVMLGRYWNGAENNGRLLSDIVEYDPAQNVWIRKGDFPGGARQNAMVFCIHEKGYIVMGENDTECKPDVWRFIP
jgi:N-acetylneuraminic acid mutarotase